MAITQTTRFPENNFRYPSIRVTELTSGPPPLVVDWRNRIGVVGVSSQGGLLNVIQNRQDFTRYIGEDQSPVSMFIRHAMLQGATNFIHSRVIPTAKPAEFAFSLQSLDALSSISEAVVAPTGDRTTGLELEMQYISPPEVTQGSFIGEPIDVPINTSELNLTDFNFIGEGKFINYIYERVRPGQLTLDGVSIPLTASLLATSNQYNLQIVEFPNTTSNIEDLFNYLKPGMILTDGTLNLKVISYVFNTDAVTYGIFVEGDVTSAGVYNLNLVPDSASSSDYQIVGVSYSSDVGSSLPANIIAQASYLGGIAPAICFYTVNLSQPLTIDLKVIEEDLDSDNLYRWVDTGININYGDAVSPTAMYLVPKGEFSITILRSIVSIGEVDTSAAGFPDTLSAFVPGMSASAVLSQLRDAIFSDPYLSRLIQEVAVLGNQLPVSIRLTTALRGTKANRVFYRLSRVTSATSPNPEPLDLLFGTGGINYDQQFITSGGTDGLRPAVRVLYDVNGNPNWLIMEASPGSGNITVNVIPGEFESGQFRLEIYKQGYIATPQDPTGAFVPSAPRPEAITLNNRNVDPVDGQFMEFQDSSLVRVFFLPVTNNSGTVIDEAVYNSVPMRKAPPVRELIDLNESVSNNLHPSHQGVTYLKNIPLLGGYTPPYNSQNPDPLDILDAIRRLEMEDVAILCLPGIVANDARYGGVISEAISQCNRSSHVTGLRILVLQSNKNLTPTMSDYLGRVYNNPRVVIVGGHGSVLGETGLGINNSSLDGFYAGMLATTSPHLSPRAASQQTGIPTLISVDTVSTPPALDRFTRNGIEVAYLDRALNRYVWLNGRTTYRDNIDQWVSVRRFSDQLIHDLVASLIWAQSQPNNEDLRRKVREACNAYLKTKLRNGEILGYQPTVCDQSNNSIRDISAGRLNIKIEWTPVLPADYINITSHRNATSEFSITSPGLT